jgi:hypothetical protein
MARTRWPSDLGNPGLKPGWADQTGSAGGCRKTWDPADRSLAGQPQWRQPIRKSGRDPGPGPYAHTTAKPRKQGQRHYPHSPCRLSPRRSWLGNHLRPRGASDSAHSAPRTPRRLRPRTSRHHLAARPWPCRRPVRSVAAANGGNEWTRWMETRVSPLSIDGVSLGCVLPRCA